MLSPAFVDMDVGTFKKLPNSTNADKSYNQLCKQATPDVLNVHVATMTTYKLDMAAALQYFAATNGMSVTFKQQTPKACRMRASV